MKAEELTSNWCHDEGPHIPQHTCVEVVIAHRPVHAMFGIACCLLLVSSKPTCLELSQYVVATDLSNSGTTGCEHPAATAPSTLAVCAVYLSDHPQHCCVIMLVMQVYHLVTLKQMWDANAFI